MGLSWTHDNDHVWGPFLYARSKHSGGFALVADSGNEDYPGATLRLQISKNTFMLALPQWLCRPHRTKVHTDWDAETVQRLGRNWYWRIINRQYGVSVREGHLVLKFGRQADDSSIDQYWSCFLPWTQWRFIEHRYYAADGTLLRTFPGSRRKGAVSWDEEYAWKKTIPTVDFEFSDFDGERITAKTYIEERVWRFGEGWFRWMGLFRKTKVRRSLDLAFSSEVGRRKGSWKGGTIGHSCDIAVGETPETAFHRYCEKQGLTFIGVMTASSK